MFFVFLLFLLGSLEKTFIWDFDEQLRVSAANNSLFSECYFSTVGCQVRDNLTAGCGPPTIPSFLGTVTFSPGAESPELQMHGISVQTLHKTTIFTDRAVKRPSGSSSCAKTITNDPEVSSAFLLTVLADVKTCI